MSAIIFLHGFPTSPDSWSATAQILSKRGYDVLLPEQRGYNEKLRPKKRREYKLSILADDIITLMDEKGIQQAHIVGHDWGGIVAWALASRYPERVATLTAVSAPHPRAFLSSLLRSNQLFLSWYMLFFQLPYVPEYILTRNNGRSLQDSLISTGLSKSIAAKYAKYMLQPGRLTGALNWYRALPYLIGESKEMNPITIPTLFVYGEKDGFLSHKAITLTQEWVKGTYKCIPLKSAPHWLPEEEPEVLAKLIEEFIAASVHKDII